MDRQIVVCQNCGHEGSIYLADKFTCNICYQEKYLIVLASQRPKTKTVEQVRQEYKQNKLAFLQSTQA